jgi:hypothetical protein
MHVVQVGELKGLHCTLGNRADQEHHKQGPDRLAPAHRDGLDSYQRKHHCPCSPHSLPPGPVTTARDGITLRIVLVKETQALGAVSEEPPRKACASAGIMLRIGLHRTTTAHGVSYTAVRQNSVQDCMPPAADAAPHTAHCPLQGALRLRRHIWVVLHHWAATQPNAHCKGHEEA